MFQQFTHGDSLCRGISFETKVSEFSMRTERSKSIIIHQLMLSILNNARYTMVTNNIKYEILMLIFNLRIKKETQLLFLYNILVGRVWIEEISLFWTLIG